VKISIDTHSRKHTAHIRVCDRNNGTIIDYVVGLDTETRLLTRIDPITKIKYTQRSDFDVFDARTGQPLTAEQIADIESGATARSEQLVDELLKDLADRAGFDFDEETKDLIRADWVKIVERWR
jgi:hypothetical protein